MVDKEMLEAVNGLGEMTRTVNESAEMHRAVNQHREIDKAVNQGREIYDAIHQDQEMYREIKKAGELYRPIVESIAAQIPESVASAPRRHVPESMLERTLDRNQKALIRIAKQQLDAATEARKHLEMLKASGLF